MPETGFRPQLNNNAAYDVTVIGGGIQGCAVAQACAAAGFKTLLIEQRNWGWATSSSSSKLIHGGLRYLQTLQFHLVRECLAERDWMIKHIPHLVQARLFYLPVYKHSRYKPWFIYLGLFFYRLLSLGGDYSQFRRLKRSEWQAIAGLKQQDLIAVFEYTDGQTDDLALTQAVQRSAAALGASCFNFTELISAEKNEKVYTLTLQQEDKPVKVISQFVVNATGPWVNECLQSFSPPVAKVNVELVQGTHLIIDQQISEHCLYVEAPSDQRAVFILPWKGKTLVGTTEYIYQGAAHDAKATDEEIAYLKQTLSFYFPELNYSVCDVFSGLRVLPRDDGAAFSRARDVMLSESEALVSLYGGKLTAWRATAQSVLTIVEAQLGQRQIKDSKKIPVV
ncbi:MAG: FAD-dependent oxidoreductase [Pseudomonadales bacterium]|nr:FAD-dependent oxidoreductase [Pseudomonadales bacterium]